MAALDTEPTRPANQEYGVRPEVANRVVADLGASDLALDAFSSGTSASHLRVCEKYWRRTGLCVEEALGSASGLDVDPLPPLGHSQSDSEDSQGPLQGSAGCSYGMHRGGKYPTLGSLIDQHDLEQGRPTGWERVSITTLRDSPCHPRDGQQNSTMWMGALIRPTPRTSCVFNRIIAESWRQCFAVPPVDIEESDSEDPLTEEEWDLVQGYMDQPFHDWGNPA